MARYFINGGINNNWGDTSNWSDTSNGTGGFSIPTASDDVYLDVFSPSCVVNSTNRVCLSINFTGYTNTFSEDSTTRTLTVSGNVTLDAGATYIFAGTLIINNTATLTSNGVTWVGSLTTSTSANTTFTLADAWIVSGNFTFGNSANLHTFNGFTVTIGGGLTISGNSSASGSDGTTGFIMNGTGTILHSGGTSVRVMRNPFTINTVGTITFDTNTVCFGGDFTYTAGTVITTGSLAYFNNNSGTKTLATNGITFNNVTFANVATTYTLSNIMVIDGILLFGTSNSNTYTINGSSISARGNVTITISSGTITGTTVLNINGTGSQAWNGTSTTPIRLNTNINKASGTLTTGALIAYNTGTITHIAGTVDTTTNSTLLSTATSTTFNVSGINWYDITISGSPTITLSSNLICNGTFTTTTGLTINGFTLYLGGSLQISTNSFTSGTTAFILNGTGTWANSSGGTVRNNLTINTAGTITIGNNVAYGTGTLTHTAGTVVTTGSTLSINYSATLNVNAINWNNVTFSTSTPTYTLTSDLNIYGTFTQSSGSLITFNGADVYCYGDVTVNASALVSITGTSDFFFSGTGTWSGGQAFDNNITITGNYTLSGTVSITGGCVLTCTAALASLTITGSTLAVQTNITATPTIDINKNLNNLSIGTSTITLSQALVCLGTLTYLNNTTTTINGFSITIGSSLTLQSSTIATGTTNFILNGTGTWSGSAGGGRLQNNLTINTAGTITLGSVIRYDTGTLTVTSGTVDGTTNNTLCYFTTTTTIDVNDNFVVRYATNPGGSPCSTHTITLLSNATFIDVTWIITNSQIVTFTGFRLRITGSLNMGTGSAGIVAGTTEIVAGGTGTYSTGISSIRNNFTINTVGTITFSPTINFLYNTGTFTYTAGTVITTGNTLIIGASTTLNTAGINWNNISISSTSIITNTSTLTISGTLTYNSGSSVTLNVSNVNVGGITYASNSNSSGTSLIIFNGTGTWNTTGAGYLRNNIEINTSGTLTFGTIVRYDTGTFTYISGTVDTATNISSIHINASTTFDTEGMIFYNFIPLGSATNITLNSHLNVTNFIQFANINHNWIGTSAFTCGTLYLATITAARTYTLRTGVTYSVLSDFICTLTNNNMKSTIKSDTPATRAVLVLGETASQNIGYLNATDIDSSAGQTIYSANGVLNNTLNWGILATPSNINAGSTFTFY